MGQFNSDLLGPTEVETWDTLMGAQDPSWNQPAPQPYVEPAADPMYAPAQELSYQQPYAAPEIGYGPDSPIYAPAEPIYGGPAEPAYVDPFMQGAADPAYAPAPELSYQDPFVVPPVPEPYFPQDQLDSWESPQNFTQDEWFSTVNGEDIGGRASYVRTNFNQNAELDPSQVQDRRYLNGDRLLTPDFLGQTMANAGNGIVAGLDRIGLNPFGEPGPAQGRLAYDENGNPLDPSLYAHFGFGSEGKPLNSASRSILSNPQFAQSNAQFDATTNPANRGSADILGGLYGGANDILRAGQDVVGDVAQQAGNYLNPYGWNAPTASGYAGGRSREDNIVGDIARFGAEAQVPGSVPDLALLALSDPAFEALGAGYKAWRNPAVREGLGDFAGRVPSVLENPAALGGDLVNIPRLFPAAEAARYPEGVTIRGGGAADDAAKWLDKIIEENPAQAKGIANYRAQFGDEAAVQWFADSGVGKTAAEAKQVLAGLADEVPAAPIDDLKAQLRKDLGIVPDDALKNAPAPGEKFPTGTVRSAADDPVDVAEREFARVTDYGPAPIYGEQAALPLNLGAAADTRSSWDKFVDEAAAAASLPRSVLASFDLSAPGRQGLALAFRHPKEWVESWVPMIKAWRTEGGAEAMARELSSINARVKSMVGTQDDLIHLYEVGADAKGLNKVPGFEGIGKGKISGAIGKVDDALGNPLGRSERAYATFLNYQKSKTFETMATAMHQAGERNLDAYRRLGEVIDHATGFGAAPLTGRLEGQAFFSQRYMTSRFQFLTDPIVEALIKRDMNAARAATENLVAFTGGLGGILALIDATGAANVEWDPRSTDFGKIRIGPQRIDFGAGFLPLIRTLSREVTGEAKASTGAVYDTSRIKEPLKFLRNKLAPIPSEAISRILGEDPVGNPNPPILSFNTLANMFAPLIAQSTVEAFKQTGSPVAAGRAAVSELFGGGTSTYGVGQAQQIDLAQNVYGKEYDSLASTQQASLNAYIVEQGGDLPYRNRQAPWWQARDDALTDWAASIDPKTLEDPFSQKALSIKDSGYVDLQPELVKWAEDTYSLPRDEAEAAVEKFLTSTGLDDQVKKYREYVLEQDPGFAKSWLDAYNNYEKDVYEPPKWIKDIAKGK